MTQHTGTGRSWKGAFTAFGLRGGTVAGALALHLLIARMLPLDQAGAAFLLIAWIGTVSISVRLGLDGYLIVQYARLLGNSSPRLVGAMLAKLSLTVISVGALGAGIAFAGVFTSVRGSDFDLDHVALAAGAAAVIPYSLAVMNTSLHKSLGQSWIANVIEGGGGSVLTLLICLAWWACGEEITVNAVYFALLGGHSLMFLTGLVMVMIPFGAAFSQQVPGMTEVPDPVRAILRKSLPFVGAGTLTYLLLWLPGLSLGWAGRLDDVSRFNAIARLGALVVFGLSVANVYAAPSIAKHFFDRDFDSLQKLAWRVANFSTAFGVIAVVASAAFGTSVMSIFGSQYATSGLALLVYCLGQLVNAFTGASTYLLQLTGSAGAAFRILLASFLTFGVGGAVGAAHYGVYPAVTGCACAFALNNLLVRRAVRRRLGIQSNPRWFEPPRVWRRD